MYGRMVTIDDHEIWVWCTPTAPLWEVLERAARQIKNAVGRRP
jgi:hypothetical protein